jgi:deoxyribose-phosphate aldolase
MFRACIGADAYDMYTSIEFKAEEHRADHEKLIEAVEALCTGKLKVICERYVFVYQSSTTKDRRNV